MNTHHVVAEVGLTYKSKQPVSSLPQITDPQSAATILRPLFDEHTMQLQEQFIVLMLNADKRCLGWSLISKGSSTGTIVDLKHIFQIVLLSNAESLILAHNHPGGRLKASTADIALTRQVQQAAQLLNLTVDDHLILSAEGYLSMKAGGLL